MGIFSRKSSGSGPKPDPVNDQWVGVANNTLRKLQSTTEGWDSVNVSSEFLDACRQAGDDKDRKGGRDL